MTERRIVTGSYAPKFARYWQIEKSIRLRCGVWRPTHKLVIENLQYHTSDELLCMEVTFLNAGRLPSGGDWVNCMHYYYSYLDWVAYGKPSFGVNTDGDICNFIGLLMQYQLASPLSDRQAVALRLERLDDDDEDSDDDIDGLDDDDDDDAGEEWKGGDYW